MRRVCQCMLLLLFLGAAGPLAEKVYYRYTDENGTEVVNDRIPPKYVPQGYEVVTLSGKVIREVPPAPSEEELERLEAEERAREEREEYNRQLRRRYSSVKDIRDAKKRKLAELQGHVSVLESNLEGIHQQIRDLQTRAARLERGGREVSEDMLDKLESLKTEVADLEERIDRREAERDKAAEEFDRDMERFRQMKAERRAPE